MGAQAFSSFDTLLAPFVKKDKLTYKEVKQCIQSFVYGVNTPSRWGCVPIDYELLTVDGWKHVDEITTDTEYFTYLETGNLSIRKPLGICIKDYDDELIQFVNDEYNYCQTVTKTHNVLYTSADGNNLRRKHAEDIALDKNWMHYTFPLQHRAFKEDKLNRFDLLMRADFDFAFKCFGGSNIAWPTAKTNLQVVNPTKINRIPYKGKVWCPSSEDNTAIFRDPQGHVFITANTQAPFSNITIDWTAHPDLKNMPAIVGGKEQDFTYGDCTEEQRMINKAFIEVMTEGDAKGQGFSYPIPNYSIMKDFDWSDNEMNRLLFEMAAKYGIPYFSNYVNSDMDPSMVKAMCPLPGNTKIRLVYNESLTEFTLKEAYKKQEFENATFEAVIPACNGLTVDYKQARINKQDPTPIIQVTLSGEHCEYFGMNHLQRITRDSFMKTVMAKEIQIGDYLPYVDTVGKFCWCKVTSIAILENSEDLYCLEVDNENHEFVLASGLITHNCRLRLDMREVVKKNGGGLFGAQSKTGSCGVVSLNMARLGYLASDEQDFFKRLDNLCDIAARSLDMKRKVLIQLMDAGLYPYTKHYIGSFNTYFSTIATVGMNEMGLNAKWLKSPIHEKPGQEFTIKVLKHIVDRIPYYQEMYDALFNLESAPAEATCYRLAKHDKERYPDIITAGTDKVPYYTNSSNIEVGYTGNIYEALENQDPIQIIYTSGTVFHAYLGQRLPDWKSAATIVKKICENYRLPNITLSPTYSICPEHGYIVGEHHTCPICIQKGNE